MLNEALLKTIACLEEDYKPLYTSLATLDEYLSEDEKKLDIHKVLRARLLNEIEQLAAGTPKGLTIHRALRALTRMHPLNNDCPYTLDGIDINNVDSYVALSTGFVFLRTPELVRDLAENRHSWKNPLTNEAYSQHDIDYIERLCNITRPAAAASTAPIDWSNLPPEVLREIIQSRLRDVDLMQETFRIMSERVGAALAAEPAPAVEGLQPAGPRAQPQPDPNPHGWSVDDMEGRSPHARQVQAALGQHEQATRQPLLPSFFSGRVNNPPQPRTRNRNCAIL